MTETVRGVLRAAYARLEAAGVPDPRHDAQALLAEAVGAPRLSLLADGGRAVPGDALARFDAWLLRREAREPLQYVLGRAAFMGRDFLAEPGVLIPRADTETLCELAVRLSPPRGDALDLCCGTGCLGVSLKLARPGLNVFAGDLSPRAVSLARRNAALHNVDMDVREGDLFAPFAGQAFDAILCNPPYVPTGELAGLQEEVRREPGMALDGGEDGLSFYRRIIAEAPVHLRPGGWLLLEVGDGQAAAVAALLPPKFTKPGIHPDLSGRPRAVTTQRNTDGR
ncbi:MAG TPA: peptide chain release factor N(5)-glutamine methyltransferase [Candidatus Limnocylindria bacterium]|nr:peptide chain release factor N(5)-glutamine methyltransferase [Candidatus Limnocylindria bacterium]